MSEQRESFIVYRSFYEAIKDLPEQNALHLYQAIFAFGLDGEEIELKGIEKTIFTLIRPQLVANWRRYENGKKDKSKKGGETDGDGGAKKQTRSKSEAKPKQSRSKPEANVNVKENRKENVKENRKENAKANALISFYSKDGKEFNITAEDVESFPMLYPGINILEMLEIVREKHGHNIPEYFSKADVLESLKNKVIKMQEFLISEDQRKHAVPDEPDHFDDPELDDPDDLLPY